MTDSKIIDLLFARDENALAVIEQKYGGYCRTVAMNILNDKYDAEECVNDALLAVWNKIPPNRPDDLGGYLARITRNIAVDRLRISGADKRDACVGEITKELEECLPGDKSAEDAVLSNELANALERFFKTLSPRERDIFLSRYFSAYSLNGISDTYGISVDYARILLSRTRKKLFDFLTKEGLL
jgi:RNA polymerase sigma-70 factor (ECF subfamily)